MRSGHSLVAPLRRLAHKFLSLFRGRRMEADMAEEMRLHMEMQEAEHRGYRLGNREKAQLADGYRDRGDRMWWDSRNVRGLPQEKDQIQKAADDYKRALELYQSIVPYGNANINIVRVQGSLNAIETRLSEL